MTASSPLLALLRTERGEETLVAVVSGPEDVRRARRDDFMRRLTEAFPRGANAQNEEAHHRFCMSVEYKIEELP